MKSYFFIMSMNTSLRASDSQIFVVSLRVMIIGTHTRTATLCVVDVIGKWWDMQMIRYLLFFKLKQPENLVCRESWVENVKGEEELGFQPFKNWLRNVKLKSWVRECVLWFSCSWLWRSKKAIVKCCPHLLSS